MGVPTPRFAVLLSIALAVPLAAQKKPLPEPITSLDGSLVLAGHGKMPDCVLDTFVHLCGGSSASIVVVAKNRSQSAARWDKRLSQPVLVLKHASPLDDTPLTSGLLAADGIWFEAEPGPLGKRVLFRELLENVLARGGALGGQGDAAVAVAHDGFLPGSFLHLLNAKDKDGKNRALDRLLKGGDGKVGWQVPKHTALVVHHGRRVGGIGEGSPVAQVAANDPWPARRKVIVAADVYEVGDELGYSVDLLAWRRSARQRTGPLFPPAKAPPCKLARGTLVLSGGGGVPSGTWRRFIKAAGGKDALIVCIPSAGIDPGERVRSYGQRQLQDHGCSNVVVLHTDDPNRANNDQILLAQLTKAAGVWIDGGRTYKFMDAFGDTRAHQLIRDVMRRGGVVGGSSAGLQVAGDFLVRGNPRSNKMIVGEGYMTGLGLLRGVILDAHFLQRERAAPFAELMKTYPQMLGIGVDEGTAIVIEKSVAEVVGPEQVSFYGMRGGSAAPVLLREGQKYDLVKRRAVK